jgi:membrane AbrB-like protein
LALGILGGWSFARLGLPLPWMLGPMTVCTLAALLRAPIAAPAVVRPPMTMVIGVLLGAGFTPGIVSQFPSWIPTIIGLAVFVVVCGFACVCYFRWVAGFDRPTAYFSGMPGGLIEMVVVGEERGGDARTIALIHSTRLLFIVFTLPFLVQWMEGVRLDRPAGFGAVGAGGALDGRSLACRNRHSRRGRGPLPASSGQVPARPHDGERARPRFRVERFQAAAGNRRRGAGGARDDDWLPLPRTPAREILRILGVSLGSTALLVTIHRDLRLAVSRVSDYSVVPLVLAYSPGGLAEMSLIALALNVEVAFVAATTSSASSS